ncbi:hypothetical protein MMPV_000536 [Pyropia vietnamensis]
MADIKPALPRPPEVSAVAGSGGGSNDVVVLLDDDDDDEILVVASSPAPKPSRKKGAASASADAGAIVNCDGSGGGVGCSGDGSGAVADAGMDIGDGMVVVASAVHLYPHARADCPSNPFIKAVTAESIVANKKACIKCFCFACDTEASKCTSWSVHCMAYDIPDWRGVRSRKKRGMALQILPSLYVPPLSSSGPTGGGSSGLALEPRSSMLPLFGLPGSSPDEYEPYTLDSVSHQLSTEQLDAMIDKLMPPRGHAFVFDISPKFSIATANPQRGLVGHLDLYMPTCGHFNVSLGRNIVPSTMSMVMTSSATVLPPMERQVLSSIMTGSMWSSDMSLIGQPWEALSTLVCRGLVSVEWEGPTHAPGAPANPRQLLNVSRTCGFSVSSLLNQLLCMRRDDCMSHFRNMKRLTKENCCRLRAKVFILPVVLGGGASMPTAEGTEEAEDDAESSSMSPRTALLMASLLNALTLYDPTPAPAPSGAAGGAASGLGPSSSGVEASTGTTAPGKGAAAPPLTPAARNRAEEKAAALAARRAAHYARALARGRLSQFNAREAEREERKKRREASVAAVAMNKTALEASEAAHIKRVNDEEAAEASKMDGMPAGMRVYRRSEAVSIAGSVAPWATCVRLDQPSRASMDHNRFHQQFNVEWGERSLMCVSNLLRSPLFCVDTGRAAAAQPPDVNICLRPYQLQALSWMESQESLQSISDPFWVQLHLVKPSGSESAAAGSAAAGRVVPFFYSPWTGHVRSERPPATVGGILAEEMGLGKTVELIALVTNSLSVSRALPMSGAGTVSSPVTSRATLIVCPVSLLQQWEVELDQRTTMRPGVEPLKVLRWYGSGRPRDPQHLAEYDIVLTTYGIVASCKAGPTSSPLIAVNWFRLVLDEAQYIRGGRSSATFRFLMAVPSIRRWSISGTPMNRQLADLQPQLEFLRVAPFERAAVWEGSFAGPYLHGQSLTGSSMTMTQRHLSMGMKLPHYILPSLSILFKALVMRHVKDQKLDGQPLVALPARHSKIVPVSLTPDETLVYDAIEKHYRNASEALTVTDMVCRRHFFQLTQNLLPLRMAAGGAASDEHLTTVLNDEPEDKSWRKPDTKRTKHCGSSGSCTVTNAEAKRLRAAFNRINAKPSSKLERMITDMRRTRDDDPFAKWVVFTEFGSLVPEIAETLNKAGLPAVSLAGHMTGPARGKVIDRFNTDLEVLGLVLARRTGAVGLTLTSANHVCLLEPGLNRATEDQAVGRVHRLGQTRPVHIHMYVTLSTVDERCVDLRRLKGEALTSGGDVKSAEEVRVERRELRRALRRERRKALRVTAHDNRAAYRAMDRPMQATLRSMGGGGAAGVSASDGDDEVESDKDHSESDDLDDDDSDSDTSAGDDRDGDVPELVTRVEEWRTLLGIV